MVYSCAAWLFSDSLLLLPFTFPAFYYFLRAGNTCIPPTPYYITIAIILLFIFYAILLLLRVFSYTLYFMLFLLYIFLESGGAKTEPFSAAARISDSPCLCALPVRTLSYSYFSISLVNALDRFSSFARWHAAKWSLPMRSNAGAWFSQICLQ